MNHRTSPIVNAPEKPFNNFRGSFDTGPGVSDAGTRIFDAFFTTKANGLGMRLAISRTILEAHHGRLWAEPNEAHGAAFHIALPVRHETELHG